MALLTPKQLRQEYARLGVPHLREDWGPRAENGESAGPPADEAWTGRSRTNLVDPSPENQWWWEDKHLPWVVRSPEEAAVMAKMEAFFAPYLAQLPRPKGNRLRQLINDRRTYAVIGDEERVSRQAAWKSARNAVRALTRLIALDDPDFQDPPDRRRRDYRAEQAAALRVYRRYWEEVNSDARVRGVPGLQDEVRDSVAATG